MPRNNLRNYSNILQTLADLATLVARYNVLESMYQNWEAMTLEKNYEDSLISLCTHVLGYLGGILGLRGEFSMFVRDHLNSEFTKIVEADKACRSFTVTIEESMAAGLDQIEDISSDDEDSDCTPKTEPATETNDQKQSLEQDAGETFDGESQRAEIGVIESATT